MGATSTFDATLRQVYAGKAAEFLADAFVPVKSDVFSCPDCKWIAGVIELCPKHRAQAAENKALAGRFEARLRTDPKAWEVFSGLNEEED